MSLVASREPIASPSGRTWVAIIKRSLFRIAVMSSRIFKVFCSLILMQLFQQSLYFVAVVEGSIVLKLELRNVSEAQPPAKFQAYEAFCFLQPRCCVFFGIVPCATSHNAEKNPGVLEIA